MNDEFYELIESAVDAAFEQNLFLFKCYHYLKYNKVKRRETVSYTHLRAHETDSYLVCRLLLEKKK